MEYLKINEEIQNIISQSNSVIYEKNNKYYNDVLDFMNLLFSEKAKIISKLRLNSFTINENILKFYNKIIEHYKLNKDQFDEDEFNQEFNFDDILDEKTKLKQTNKLIKFVLTLCNNLLERLGYKIVKTKKNKFYLDTGI